MEGVKIRFFKKYRCKKGRVTLHREPPARNAVVTPRMGDGVAQLLLKFPLQTERPASVKRKHRTVDTGWAEWKRQQTLSVLACDALLDDLVGDFDNLSVAKRAKATTIPPIPLEVPYRLYPYQERVVAWLRECESVPHPHFLPGTHGGLLSMEMGLGKTLCIASLIFSTLSEQRRVFQPSLYVCPKNAMGTACYEFQKFFGGRLRVFVFHRDLMTAKRFKNFQTEEFQRYDVVITNYASLTSSEKHSAKIRRVFGPAEWYRIVMDESHALRDVHSKRFHSARHLRSSRRLAMTGTPIHERFSDLVHQLQFTGLIPEEKKKITRDTFEKLALDKVVCFVEHADTGVQLPTLEYHVHKVVLSPPEQAAYDQSIAQATQLYQASLGEHGRLRRQKVASGQALTTQALQVCSGATVTTQPATKLQHFLSFLRDVWGREPQTKLLLFANHEETLERVQQALDMHFPGQSVWVRNSMTTPHREAAYTRFRTEPNLNLLLMTLKLGAASLNLAEAHVVCFFEPWHSFSYVRQAVCRVHRLGQVRPVHVHFWLAQGTLEEQVYQRMWHQRTAHAGMIGGTGSGPSGWPEPEEMMDMLRASHPTMSLPPVPAISETLASVTRDTYSSLKPGTSMGLSRK